MYKAMRMNSIMKIILLCTFFVLSSCNEDIAEKIIDELEPSKAGVVLSFDDAYVDEWYNTNTILKKYDWKATFFVCKINTLKHAEIKKLLELQRQGNEIAAHGLHHYNAATFLKDHTIDDYLKEEINPMMSLMNFYGLKVSTFAYPYGARTKALDAALLKKFKIIRGRAFCEEIPSKQNSYYEHSNLIFSFSVDDTHEHFNIPHLLSLLNYAKKNNKILILNSHKTLQNATGDYETTNATLEMICQYIKRNNMKFYTVSDLEKMN
ncbi:MAG: polysaccharide deacetylase family protein [Flavobacterium sp.]